MRPYTHTPQNTQPALLRRSPATPPTPAKSHVAPRTNTSRSFVFGSGLAASLQVRPPSADTRGSKVLDQRPLAVRAVEDGARARNRSAAARLAASSATHSPSRALPHATRRGASSIDTPCGTRNRIRHSQRTVSTRQHPRHIRSLCDRYGPKGSGRASRLASLSASAFSPWWTTSSSVATGSATHAYDSNKLAGFARRPPSRRAARSQRRRLAGRRAPCAWSATSATSHRHAASAAAPKRAVRAREI